MISIALALILLGADTDPDAGTWGPPSGFVAVESGMFLRQSDHSLISVDGGAWCDDATLMETAMRQRIVREQLKLMSERQTSDIAKWIGLGATIGSVLTVIFTVFFVNYFGK